MDESDDDIVIVEVRKNNKEDKNKSSEQKDKEIDVSGINCDDVQVCDRTAKKIKEN